MLISFVNVGGLGLTQPVAALDANAVHGLKMIRDGLDGRALTHGRRVSQDTLPSPLPIASLSKCYYSHCTTQFKANASHSSPTHRSRCTSRSAAGFSAPKAGGAGASRPDRCPCQRCHRRVPSSAPPARVVTRATRTMTGAAASTSF